MQIYLIKYLKYIGCIDNNSTKLVSIIVFFMPIFFLTVKSWVTTSIFLLFLICGWSILRNPSLYFSKRGPNFWILLLCLVIPFFAEFFAQVGRGEIVGSNLDGPARMLLAAGIFVYFCRFECTRVIHCLSYGSALGVFGVFLSLLIFPDYYWGSRAATYFVDPITLPCYTVGLLGLFLFFVPKEVPSKWTIYIKSLLVLLTVYIVIASASRSAYVAFICLMTFHVIFCFRHSFKTQIFGLLGLIIALMLVYFFSDSVYQRVNESVSGVMAFFFEGENSEYLVQKTSSGQRLVLGLIDLYLIKNNLFFGFADRAALPPYEELRVFIPSLTEEVYWIKVSAGSHAEFLAQLVRQGVFFGSFTLMSLFFYPLYLFLWRYRYLTFSKGSLLALPLGILIPILVSSMTIQVFNLKMTISFYGVCVALFFAYLYRQADMNGNKC